MADTFQPILIPISPQDGQTNVDKDSLITFTVDDNVGIVPGSLSANIDRGAGAGLETAFVFSDVTQFKSGFDGAGSSVTVDGTLNTIVIDMRPLPIGNTVTIEVLGLDAAGNVIVLGALSGGSTLGTATLGTDTLGG
ncbi:MAG: hypothetical protein ACYTBJ_17400 [Planctomycetota bacterium]|jgi:hypothetical protein